MKHEIASAVDLNPALLPYNEELLALLRAQSEAGRSVVLATGADRKVASAVATIWAYSTASSPPTE